MSHIVITTDRQLIAWCGECRAWTPIEEIGYCLNECDLPSGKWRRQRKRLAYVCPECRCSYFKMENYREHICHECY